VPHGWVIVRSKDPSQMKNLFDENQVVQQDVPDIFTAHYKKHLKSRTKSYFSRTGALLLALGIILALVSIDIYPYLTLRNFTYACLVLGLACIIAAKPASQFLASWKAEGAEGLGESDGSGSESDSESDDDDDSTEGAFVAHPKFHFVRFNRYMKKNITELHKTLYGSDFCKDEATRRKQDILFPQPTHAKPLTTSASPARARPMVHPNESSSAESLESPESKRQPSRRAGLDEEEEEAEEAPESLSRGSRAGSRRRRGGTSGSGGQRGRARASSQTPPRARLSDEHEVLSAASVAQGQEEGGASTKPGVLKPEDVVTMSARGLPKSALKLLVEEQSKWERVVKRLNKALDDWILDSLRLKLGLRSTSSDSSAVESKSNDPVACRAVSSESSEDRKQRAGKDVAEQAEGLKETQPMESPSESALADGKPSKKREWIPPAQRIRMSPVTLAKSYLSQTRLPRVFAFAFDGDIYASAVSTSLTPFVDLVLRVAIPGVDRVLLVLTSPGGLVASYGLAASQLARLREHGIHVTACVDTVAASGGYMMACVCDQIIAAPFSYIGSIGVLAQIPNFNKLIRKADIDYYEFHAGRYKRQAGLLNEIDEDIKSKMHQQLAEIHHLFATHVAKYRPQLASIIDNLATGEVWLGTDALAKGLIDGIGTSHELMSQLTATHEVLVVTIKRQRKRRKSLLATLLDLFCGRSSRGSTAETLGSMVSDAAKALITVNHAQGAAAPSVAALATNLATAAGPVALDPMSANQGTIRV